MNSTKNEMNLCAEQGAEQGTLLSNPSQISNSNNGVETTGESSK
jgi:hypothetical protein